MESTQQLREMLQAGLFNMKQELTSPWLGVQLGIILVAAIIGALVGRAVRRHVDLTSLGMGWPGYARLLVRLLIERLRAIVFIVIVAVVRAGLLSATWPSHSYVLGVSVSLASAWLAIAILTALIRNSFIQRLVSIFAWAIATLSIVGLLRPTMSALDAVGVVVGGVHITPLLVIKATALLALTLWVANAAADFIDRRIETQIDLTPSIRVLIGKIIRLLLLTFAVLIVLSSVGIDFSALALFSGAIGVGIGFGLQKIVSNLFSGIILLADKSVKPGDVISIDDQIGRVTNMNARFTSVATLTGREILIPNEDFISQRVVNWSYSSQEVVLEVKFGVSYDSDPHKVRELALAAARSAQRVLETPAPFCHFGAFGDSSLDFSLGFWIRDPTNGIGNVRSEVMLALWDAFKREGIEIPFPIRDVRLTETTPKKPKLGGGA